jgi:hypothetical protein
VIDFATNSGVPNATVALAEYLQPPAQGFRATTDAAGSYRITVPSGEYWIYVDDVATAVFFLYEPAYRGDLLVNAGGCSARYGLVSEAHTRRPIPGVSVSLVGFQTQTDAGGWYRLDIGCLRSYGTGTTFMTFSRAGYADRSVIAGRRESLAGLGRVDATLTPK